MYYLLGFYVICIPFCSCMEDRYADWHCLADAPRNSFWLSMHKNWCDGSCKGLIGVIIKGEKGGSGRSSEFLIFSTKCLSAIFWNWKDEEINMRWKVGREINIPLTTAYYRWCGGEGPKRLAISSVEHCVWFLLCYKNSLTYNGEIGNNQSFLSCFCKIFDTNSLF